MSSTRVTGQVVSSSSPGTKFRSILDYALADYSKTTEIDLYKSDFAVKIQIANSPEAIVQLLEEQANDFKEVRDGNRRLTSILEPAVNVLQAFSGLSGEGHEDHEVGGREPHVPYDEPFQVNVTSSAGPLSTSESCICWDRYTLCYRCTSLEPVLLKFSCDERVARLPVGIHPSTMSLSSSLNA